MPAVLNEAFRSPFDKVSGQGGKGPDPWAIDSDTADIRYNPDVQNLDFSEKSQRPYQVDYQIKSPAPSAGITWGIDPNQTLPQVPQTRSQSASLRLHNCDQLIGDIMACRVCRQKLQRLLNAWEEDHPEEMGLRNNGRQEGGAPMVSPISAAFSLNNLSPTLITNIIIGIAIIFLLDRILKLRLAVR
jgi:hypothetical protein